MIENVNQILNCGDIPGIYSDVDIQEIVSHCKVDCMKLGMQPNKMNIFQCYLNRI